MRSRRAYPPGTVRRVRAQYAAGRTIAEISAREGIPASTLRGLMDRHGIERRPAIRRRMRPEPELALCGHASADECPCDGWEGSTRRRENDLTDYAWLLRAGETRESARRRLGVIRDTGDRWDRLIRDRAGAGDEYWAYVLELIRADGERAAAVAESMRRAAS